MKKSVSKGKKSFISNSCFHFYSICSFFLSFFLSFLFTLFLLLNSLYFCLFVCLFLFFFISIIYLQVFFIYFYFFVGPHRGVRTLTSRYMSSYSIHFCSIPGLCSWERHENSYPLSYRLKKYHPCSSTGMSLTLIYIFTNPSAQAGYDTRSIFKRSLTGLNSEFSFS